MRRMFAGYMHFRSVRNCLQQVMHILYAGNSMMSHRFSGSRSAPVVTGIGRVNDTIKAAEKPSWFFTHICAVEARPFLGVLGNHFGFRGIVYGYSFPPRRTCCLGRRFSLDCVQPCRSAPGGAGPAAGP